jgi:hypothetical protein
LYCLPYFYAEDCEKDQVFDVTVPIEVKSDEIHAPPRHIVFDGVTLTPIKEIFSFRKTGDVHSFWFKNESDEPFVLEVKSGNALLNLVRGLFKREQITVKSSTRIVRMSGYRKKQNYYKLINPELVE